MGGLRLVPAAKGLFDGDELNVRELALELLRHFGKLRTIIILRRDGLTFGRVKEFEIRFCNLFGAALLHHAIHPGDRRLGEDAERGVDDLELVAAVFLHGEKGFVFPRDEHVTDAALHEGRGRSAGAGVEHGDVLEELSQVLNRLGRVAAVVLRGPRPGGKVVPARTAGGLRVGRNDRDAGLDEVAPILDPLGISFAHEKDNRARVGRAVVRKAFLPVLRHGAHLVRERVDVVTQRQGDDIRIQTIHDGARLFAGAAVGLFDGEGVAGLFLPMFGEGGVELGVKLARRVVGDVEQGDVLRGCAGHEQQRREHGQGEGDEAFLFHRESIR